MSHEVIYFDLGGVVFTDFFSGGEVGLSEALQLSSQAVLDAYQKTDLSGYCKDELSDEVRWKSFVDELGLPESCVQTCIDEYYRSYQIIPETVTFLKELARAGTHKLGVLSDQPMGITNYLRKTYPDIFSLFESELVLISAEIHLSKKDADLAIYKLAIERAGITAPEALFVDNSSHNIDNAKSLGIGAYFFDIKEVEAAKLLDGLRQQI